MRMLEKIKATSFLEIHLYPIVSNCAILFQLVGQRDKLKQTAKQKG